MDLIRNNFFKKGIDKQNRMCYNVITIKKGTEKKMKKVNIWRSEYTGEIYKMPVDWLPKFGGWQLIGTEEED